MSNGVSAVTYGRQGHDGVVIIGGFFHKEPIGLLFALQDGGSQVIISVNKPEWIMFVGTHTHTHASSECRDGGRLTLAWDRPYLLSPKASR